MNVAVPVPLMKHVLFNIELASDFNSSTLTIFLYFVKWTDIIKRDMGKACNLIEKIHLKCKVYNTPFSSRLFILDMFNVTDYPFQTTGADVSPYSLFQLGADN